MRPLDLQPIGSELAIKWDDGSEDFIKLETLRKRCPCAGCRGEMDIFGGLYKGPEQAYSPAAFELRRIERVGGYAVRPVWGDGHASGLYTFDYLKELGRA